MHSKFFSKFLDSPENISTGDVPDGGFKYEWVTQVDKYDAQAWLLVALKDGMVCLFKVDLEILES